MLYVISVAVNKRDDLGIKGKKAKALNILIYINKEGQRIAKGSYYESFTLTQRFDGYSYREEEIELSHSSHS